jgi:hypothetical protein
MSQTVVPAAPPGAAPNGPAPNGPSPDGQPGLVDAGTATLRGRLVAASAALRHALSGTPGRLRAMSALAIVGALIVGFGAGAALRERSAALSEASSTAQHLVLLQAIQTNLATADAEATNSFLAFGLEPREQRQEYLNAIRDASRDLAIAAQASPADAEVLGRVNQALTTYTSYVASARANNLQGFPVGASYLQAATTLLQEEVLKPLMDRSTADRQAIDAAYSRAGRASWWLALVVIIGLGAMMWVQIDLARRTRRYVNVPLAAATVALVIGLVVAGAAMAVAQSRANDVKDGALARTIALSQSRVKAFTAKSIESLTLINRGSAPTNEPNWQDSFKAASSSLLREDSAAHSDLLAWKKEHVAIRALDDRAKWQEARKRAISMADGSANAEFKSYASRTGRALTDPENGQVEATKAGLAKAGDLLLPAGILIVMLGLLAAVSAWWGFTLRLDEYR